MPPTQDATHARTPAGEDVPLDDIAPDDWRDLVVPPSKRKQERINRIAYEMCVLNSLREKLR